MQTEDIVSKLQIDDGHIRSKMLHDLVQTHRNGRGAVVAALEQRYRQKGLPILTRVTRNPNKIDERVPSDFFADITDTKQGYMGNEVIISLPDGDDAQIAVLHDFQRLNYSVDQNSEMVKAASRDGEAYRLLYIPEGRNEIRVRQLPASETVIFTDESLGLTMYGMRYWYVDDKTYEGVFERSTKRTVVEWYDRDKITYFIDNGRGEYSLDKTKGKDGEQLHLFDGVPIFRFLNNEEGMGEAEKAINLIDAYDTILSATISEVEQFRLAYLALKDAGGVVDNEFMQRLEQTGVFPLGPNGDAKFVTKDAAIDGVKVLLDEIRKNIYQFSRSIDLSKDFGGDLRVIGWQVALLNLENSCKVTQRKFEKALREQYTMVTDKWREWGVGDIDPLDIEFDFTRNFPKDLASEAKILLDLQGTVSKQTALSQMSFIDDPEAELERMKEDEEMFGTSLMGVADESEPSPDFGE